MRERKQDQNVSQGKEGLHDVHNIINQNVFFSETKCKQENEKQKARSKETVSPICFYIVLSLCVGAASHNVLLSSAPSCLSFTFWLVMLLFAAACAAADGSFLLLFSW